ncbi:MAG: outer membrane protein assembly factor BamA [Bryobacteraceae bacterium]
MSAFATRASVVCLWCSVTLGVFSGAGLAKPLFSIGDSLGELVSQDANSLPEAAASAQTNAGQSGTQPRTTTPPQNPTQQQRPPQTPPQQTRPNNPFENVPTAPETPKTPEKPNPSGVQEAKPVTVGENIIEAVEFRGQRKVPQDTLRALIYTKKGDVYDEESLHRDFIALWNTGRFDDLRIEKEKGPAGGIILRFVVTERRTVHTIDYTGNKSISKSEILDRLKERKVSLTPESQYDPGKVQRAKNVLQEYESERGHQYATVTPQIRQVPPGGVDVTFAIDEGPKVKVGHIVIDGNNAFSDRQVIRAMKNLKPIGIPHSLLFENLFARTYDSTKLDEDSDRIRQFYQTHGYFTARVINHSEKIYDVHGRGIKVPIFNPKKPGKRVDITMVVREGDLFTLRNFQFVGMKLFRTPDLIGRQVFKMGPGDVFSTEKLQKGLEDLRKLYGNFGYIDFVPSPDPEVVPGKPQIDLTIDVDEGHQFFVRRIDFQGNTTTRDKVIRREILIDEGDLYSQQLWETSILRLNQLGYFDPLKAEDAADVKRDTKTNTVDLLLKVKERGKNSIQLNGGVSGISGSFIGFSYSTNNFLGLGETLSLGAQVGTLLDNITFGFTEPYLFDKPIQAGFTVFYQRYSYDQGQQASILAGQNLTSYYNSLGTQNLLNYVTNGAGFTSFLSYALHRSFARVGLSYGYSVQNVTPITDAAKTYFTYLNFQGVGGPNSLEGITTSTITPTYAYNTVNHPIIPTRGLRVNASFAFSGSFLGGNVNTIQPALDMAYFRRGILRNHVMGFHVNARFISGFGGKVAPPYSRYYMGGEDDIRGFNILTISPIAYIPTDTQIPVLNNDGSARVQKVVNADGTTSNVGVTQTIPTYQLILPGGDTAVVFNYEYRIPIVGPVTLAPFIDAGVDRLTLPSQLGLNADRVNQLNAIFPQADFGKQAYVAPGTQVPRVSAGLELQVLMPVVNAPFRLYWAYNLSVVNTVLQPPIAADRSFFPNNATYQSALAAFGQSTSFSEKRSLFRFSIGRTF